MVKLYVIYSVRYWDSSCWLYQLLHVYLGVPELIDLIFLTEPQRGLKIDYTRYNAGQVCVRRGAKTRALFESYYIEHLPLLPHLGKQTSYFFKLQCSRENNPPRTFWLVDVPSIILSLLPQNPNMKLATCTELYDSDFYCLPFKIWANNHGFQGSKQQSTTNPRENRHSSERKR